MMKTKSLQQFNDMPQRIPETFSFPIVYPNGTIIYCDTKEEQDIYQRQIDELMEWLENE